MLNELIAVWWAYGAAIPVTVGVLACGVVGVVGAHFVRREWHAWLLCCAVVTCVLAGIVVAAPIANGGGL